MKVRDVVVYFLPIAVRPHPDIREPCQTLDLLAARQGQLTVKMTCRYPGVPIDPDICYLHVCDLETHTSVETLAHFIRLGICPADVQSTALMKASGLRKVVRADPIDISFVQSPNHIVDLGSQCLLFVHFIVPR